MLTPDASPLVPPPVISPDPKEWCEKALKSVLDIWDYQSHQAYQTADFKAKEMEKPDAKDRSFQPTVTYNAVLAFADAGLYLSGTKLSKSGTALECEPAQLAIPDIQFVLSADATLLRLLNQKEWVETAIKSSLHGTKPKPESKKARALTRQVMLLLAPMTEAIASLVRHASPEAINAVRGHLAYGVAYIESILTRELFPEHDELRKERTIADGQAKLSVQLAMYTTTVIRRCRELKSSIGQEWMDAGLPTSKYGIENLIAAFQAYFVREVERQLANKLAPLETAYDPTSLAYTLGGWVEIDDQARRHPLFRFAVESVASAQLSDGCWPPGATIYFESSDSPVRQPSVEIALQLAKACFERPALYRCEENEERLLRLGLPPLINQLTFLAASFQQHSKGSSGWEDDRLRTTGTVRTYINAVAARLINTVRLAKIALERCSILRKYEPKWSSPPGEEPWRGFPNRDSAARWSEVIEPDGIIKPCERLWKRVIDPVSSQMRSGHYFLRPDKNGVSFILYGPPGSGKTYLLDKFAAALGWPLVSLSPGHFIKNGLEQIESTASAIFADLRRLDHAVVLFDECDELFRQRPVKGGDAGRNILSFATASMLPKLQDLHDARKVVFVLATNYVANLDRAIRRDGRFDLLLLYDRPDKKARQIGARSSLEQAVNLLVDGETLDHLASQIADVSAGWMPKQVREYAVKFNAKNANRELLLEAAEEVSIGDYCEWCHEDGQRELLGAQVEDSEIKRKLKQWDSFITEGSHASARRGT